MQWSRRQGRSAAALTLASVACITLGGLSSFGIWDPWELSAADLARQLASGEGTLGDRPPLSLWLVSRGFALFGIHEWSGRLPMALGGLLAVGLAYLLVARFTGRRAAVWAALIAGTSPLFLLNARQMLGAAPAFATSAAVFTCALCAVFRPAPLRASPDRRRLLRGLWLLGLLVSAAAATLASGVLLGVAPPLLAVGVTILSGGEIRRPFADKERSAMAAGVLTLAMVAGVGAAHAVWADYAGFGWWTGGVPRGGDPATWEVAIEHLFHSFAPWSALLPLALAGLLVEAPRPLERPSGHLAPTSATAVARYPEENALRLALVAWVAFGYLAQTVYTARFGPATFLPLVGASAAVAILLHDVERSGRAWWSAAVVSFLFVGLIVRDFRAYPNGPVEGLAVEGVGVPEVFNPKLYWAGLLGYFALLLSLGLAADPSSEHQGLRRILRQLGEHWRAGGRDRLWAVPRAMLRLCVPAQLLAEPTRAPADTSRASTNASRRSTRFAARLQRAWELRLPLVVASVLTFATAFGVAAWAAPESLLDRLGMTSLGVRIGRALVLLAPALFAVIATCRFGLFLFAQLGPHRLVPAATVALGVGAYTSLGFQPELSSHFSPREVYDTYNELAAPDEPLGEFRVGGRAAAYYASGEILELDSQTQLIEFLQREGRVWAAFRADDLASIDRAYRRRAGRHLFIADARSARMLLATNHPVEGVEDQNYLSNAVLDEAPRPQREVHVNFDDRIHLLGYDLDLPHGGYVGPGEAFTITWYFRVAAPVPGSYQPFVHIDGPGQRINGDHEPVDGRYPVRLWEPDDIVVDRQELRVPANYRRASLTIYMGFYAGEQRLEVKEGPADDENRARVGTLTIR